LFNSIVDEVDTTCFGAVFVVSMAHWIGAMWARIHKATDLGVWDNLLFQVLVKEEIIISSYHQTYIAQETITANINKLQDVLKNKR
jgi:hypothetical protein